MIISYIDKLEKKICGRTIFSLMARHGIANKRAYDAYYEKVKRVNPRIPENLEYYLNEFNVAFTWEKYQKALTYFKEKHYYSLKDILELAETHGIEGAASFRKLRQTRVELKDISFNYEYIFTYINKSKSIAVTRDDVIELLDAYDIHTLTEARKTFKESAVFASVFHSPNKYFKDYSAWFEYFERKPVALSQIAPLNTKKKFITFDQAKKLVQSKNIKNMIEFKKRRKTDLALQDIYSNPDTYYKEWRGSADFFGAGRVVTRTSKKYASFKEAQEICLRFNIRSSSDFYEKRKKDRALKDVPYAPHLKYSEWAGWNEFLQKKGVGQAGV